MLWHRRWAIRGNLPVGKWIPAFAGMTIGVLQRAIPFAEIDVDRAHRDAVLPGVADDLGRRVEPHRLTVQEGAGEDFGVDAFDPGRDIDEEGKARGVAFREAVGAEPLDLVEAAGR